MKKINILYLSIHIFCLVPAMTCAQDVIVVTLDEAKKQGLLPPVESPPPLDPPMLLYDSIPNTRTSPMFPGGEVALKEWLSKNLIYPTEAHFKGICGIVKVSFMVNTDGSIKNTSIIEHVHPLLDAEALRIINEMPKWIPGNGQTFPIEVILPVRFLLPDESIQQYDVLLIKVGPNKKKLAKAMVDICGISQKDAMRYMEKKATKIDVSDNFSLIVPLNNMESEDSSANVAIEVNIPYWRAMIIKTNLEKHGAEIMLEKRVDIYITNVGSSKLKMVKFIKDNCNLTLSEAKDMYELLCDNLDRPLFTNVSKNDAMKLKKNLEEAGATAIFKIRSSSEETAQITSSKTVSKSITFCTDDQHPHLIDLGLPSGTKWACCNVGAIKPEEFGNHYAWGETETKYSYNYKTYSYNQDDSYVSLGSDIAGTRYDVAHVMWGGSWVMPSRAQQEELLDNCTYTWTTLNGVSGGKFTSKRNGKSIFLPAAGFRLDYELYYVGSFGSYWSSTQNPSNKYDAYFHGFDSDDADWDNGYGREAGRGVRPVCK